MPKKGKVIEMKDSMLQSLATMFNTPDLSDVIVCVGPHKFHLHKVLLMQSSVLKVMMSSKNWDDSKQTELKIHEEDFCIPHMEMFFKYFYTGEVMLTEKNVVPLLVLANKYDLHSLEEACEQFGADKVCEGTDLAQVLEWYFMALRVDLQHLQDRCRTFLLLNMTKVFRSALFLDLTIDQLILFLQESDMVVNAEVTLFLRLWKWLEHNAAGCTKKMEEFVVQLLPFVKFSMMNHDHLIAVEKRLRKVWPSREKFNLYFAGYLLDAYKFHAIPFHRRPRVGIGHLDHPRLYTDATTMTSCLCMLLPVSAEIIGETFSGKIPVSLSSADQGNVKMWGGQVSQAEGGAELEMWLMGEKVSINCIVDITVLIHKQVNGERLMEKLLHHCQLVERKVRCIQGPTHGGGTPVKFGVKLAEKIFQEDSPYLIQYQKKKCCILNIFVRHLQPDVPTCSNVQNDDLSSEEDDGSKLVDAADSL
ncbi:hypothetical protein LSH36_35g01039 [Paralvinella palmiformis]|uniref:BTB domain-containing protein n=1 Tax=Paralvinella palmiformis TaxID=53620 RepID=A0AAD9K8F9_9ANNE|nr:hypothetical protein LSH36_35g01039 [Paralvinella palmiformis]